MNRLRTGALWLGSALSIAATLIVVVLASQSDTDPESLVRSAWLIVLFVLTHSGCAWRLSRRKNAQHRRLLEMMRRKSASDKHTADILTQDQERIRDNLSDIMATLERISISQREIHSSMVDQSNTQNATGQIIRSLELRLRKIQNVSRSDQRVLNDHLALIESAAEEHHRRTRNLLTQRLDVSGLARHMRKAETRLLTSIDSAALLHGDALENLGNQIGKIHTVAHDAHAEFAKSGLGVRRLDESLERLQSSLVSTSATASAELSRLDHRVDELHSASARAELKRSNEFTQIDETLRGLKSRVTNSSNDVVSQVEALLQLLPRVDTQMRRYPATGGWAMSATGLLLVTDLILAKRPRLILELGSGSSTVWVGNFAKQYGGRVVSIEHDVGYAASTRQLLEDHDLVDSVDLRLSPLKEQTVGERNVMWYDPSFIRDLADVDMLIIDGPPKATGQYARFPALPLLIDTLSTTSMIVVDDYQREQERTIVREWLALYPDLTVFMSIDRVGVLSRGNQG